MKNLIGEKLENAIEYLNSKGFKCEILDNNYNVDGDKKLVTNIILVEKIAQIITGNFVFDVKNKSKNLENKWNKEYLLALL